MIKVTVVGSCLSELSIKSQKDNFEFVKHGMHLRSDLFLAALEGKFDQFLTQAELTSRLEQIGVDVNRNSARIKFQSLEYIRDVLSSINVSDLFVMDFNYDLSRAGYSFPIDNHWSIPYIFNFENVKPDDELCKNTGLLSVEETVENIRKAIALVKVLNPNILIKIINYPYSGFEYLKRGKERISRSKELSEKIETLLKNDASIIPLLDIDERYLTEKGGHYFQNDVYRNFGDAILKTSDKAEGIIEINLFEEIIK